MSLTQLYAYGCGDVWIIAQAEAEKAVPYNFPKYNNHCFVHGEIDVNLDTSIQHQSGVTFPFNVKKEKAAYRIQNAWKTAITNPSFAVCKRRLMREFEGLVNNGEQ
jgi:hypothetical protein